MAMDEGSDRADYRRDEESYLTDAVGAFDVSLTRDEVTYLEEAYVLHPIVGEISQNPPQGVVLLDAKK